MAVYDQFVLCKAAALVFAVARWLLSVALDLPTGLISNSAVSSPRCSSSNVRTMIRGSLSLTTLGNIDHKLPEGGGAGLSCAVCLKRLRKSSQLWELSNCCHVFHKNCLEKWLCYDSRLTCPLCRAPLLASAAASCSLQPQPPSWAVERMLYLFGDDLLP